MAVFLGEAIQNQPRCALLRVFKHKCHGLQASAQANVPQERLAPQLGDFPRRVAVAIAEAKIANDNGGVTFGHANVKCSTQFLLDHVTLFGKRIFGTHVRQPGQADRWHGAHGKDPPLRQLLVAVVGAPEDDYIFGQNPPFDRDRIVCLVGLGRGSCQRGREGAPPAKAFLLKVNGEHVK